MGGDLLHRPNQTSPRKRTASWKPRQRARRPVAEAPICGVAFRWAAVAAHREGSALLICSGGYLAFLPSHFAAPWVAAGAMRGLDPGRFAFHDRLQIVQPCKARPPAAPVLEGCLRAHLRGAPRP